jgi:hypothetical protein
LFDSSYRWVASLQLTDNIKSSQMVADQYSSPNSVIKTLKGGEQVILDYDLTIESIFSILYW